MHISAGTFNLNNLFSRYNFELKANVEGLAEGEVTYTKIRNIVDTLHTKPVDYEGRAVKRKDPEDRQKIIDRIRAMNLDILCVQEVEDIETLRYFANHELKDKPEYPHIILVEGNDARLIDVALLSKYPIGAVTTWQHAAHSKMSAQRVFSRDLLQVEILQKNRKDPLFTVFNTHLKSHFVPFNEDQKEGQKTANERRRQQAETIAHILENQMPPDTAYMVLGDMNDGPESAFLRPFADNFDLRLVNGLADAQETQAAPSSTSPPATKIWTYRFKETGQPAEYELYDHIWLSPALATKQTGAFIHRRTKMGGDGSDHDPAWIELDV